MFFKVLKSVSQMPSTGQAQAFLAKEQWSDRGLYRTAFRLVVFDDNRRQIDLGRVKIGHFNFAKARRNKSGLLVTELPKEFDGLSSHFFSLGQDENYYEAINHFLGEIRTTILVGLRDCSFDSGLFDRAFGEDVMQASLLRGVSAETVSGRFYRLAHGDAKLTSFDFRFACEFGEDGRRLPPIDFHVMPHRTPPLNVHVLIGRNGSGKSGYLRYMMHALAGNSRYGEFERLPYALYPGGLSFSSVVFVSFSAFDPIDMPRVHSRVTRLEMIGLRDQRVNGRRKRSESEDQHEFVAKTPRELTIEFSESFKACSQGLRRDRLIAAIRTLEADPLFADANVGGFLAQQKSEWEGDIRELFSRLSSGHAIVLLTMTRLVELVDERTLVLIDEPESHLHPPLLAAFVRALSDLLVKRNGVAILATHSPVVLQEVPRSCVWKLRRSGEVVHAERPEIETFGESVGVLTREAFGLEVTGSGFHRMIREAIDEGLPYEAILERFGGQLGGEARAIARALIAQRDAEREEGT